MIKSKRTKKILIISTIVLLLIIIGIGTFFSIVSMQLNKIPNMTFTEMMNFTTKNNENAAISVGIIKNGNISYNVYKNNGTIVGETDHTYEIGSITKTVTATLIYKAIEEDKIELESTIDNYLNLPQKEYYPTIKRLLTHTSGYKSYYFESEMISNFFTGKNDFYGISKQKLINRIGKINLKNKDYEYKYSNFGFAVLGLVLAEVYNTDYTQLVNNYLISDLRLNNTKISDQAGDLSNYWDWKENDVYLSAGELTSTISDMLKYAQLQLNPAQSYITKTHNKLTDKSGNTKKNLKININIDYIGASWIGDTVNNVIWHNGATGKYNSYIGFDKKNQLAVVILSNLSPSFRIPATVMGIKLLTDLQHEVAFNK